MSTKQDEEVESVTISVEPETSANVEGNSDRDARVRFRAYEIYLSRDRECDSELDDWLQAEREMEDLASESRLLS